MDVKHKRLMFHARGYYTLKFSVTTYCSFGPLPLKTEIHFQPTRSGRMTSPLHAFSNATTYEHLSTGLVRRYDALWDAQSLRTLGQIGCQKTAQPPLLSWNETPLLNDLPSRLGPEGIGLAATV